MTLPAGVHVRVVGTGLIGTSIGLALTRTGAVVSLEDPSTTACALARDLGAGVLAAEVRQSPALVVVAAPPDAVAAAVVRELATWPEAVVTDVASVKLAVLDQVTALGGDLRRYVGSHPMAGRERSGAIAAQADLFEGRSWVVAPGPAAGEAAVAAVLDLAVAVGAAPIRMTPADHDAAVAAVSHVPQIAASLVAARLRELPDSAVALAGQGIRDVTRIAASDPMMWTQILAGNAPALGRCWRSWRSTSTRCCRPFAPWTPAPATAATGRAPAACSPAPWPAATPGTHGSPASTAARRRRTRP